MTRSPEPTKAERLFREDLDALALGSAEPPWVAGCDRHPFAATRLVIDPVLGVTARCFECNAVLCELAADFDGPGFNPLAFHPRCHRGPRQATLAYALGAGYVEVLCHTCLGPLGAIPVRSRER